ncbi:MAG TPA: hypothetical protein VFR40_00150 [Lapillicoccus sp.]|nr:hypothetical protein [Lapillicoccus sp.]
MPVCGGVVGAAGWGAGVGVFLGVGVGAVLAVLRDGGVGDGVPPGAVVAEVVEVVIAGGDVLASGVADGVVEEVGASTV